MDFLAGYGSDSEGDDGSTIPSAIRSTAPNTGSAVENIAFAVGPKGLFSSLPAPKDAAPPAMAASNRHSHVDRDSVQSNLPEGFFDDPADADALVAPSEVTTGFFDAPGIAGTVSASSDAAKQGATDSLRPVAAPAEDLPQPSDTELWKKLPAPRTSTQAKRKVLFRPQINMELLAGSDSDDDDTPAAKRAAPAAGAAGKPSMLSFLPAPKNQPAVPKGFASSTRLQASSQVPKQAQASSQQQADAGAYPASPGAGNEAYRLVNPLNSVDYQQHQQQAYNHYSYDPNDSAATAAVAAYHGDAAVLPPEEAFLQEALQAEASKAARRAAGGGSAQLVLPDIQFKEINADNIKYVDPAQREATQGMRAALGTDYAAKLRAQAAPHMGSKLARSKHQIGTLFANAKLRELEVLEQRAAGMKSKSETAGKYGWR